MVVFGPVAGGRVRKQVLLFNLRFRQLAVLSDAGVHEQRPRHGVVPHDGHHVMVQRKAVAGRVLRQEQPTDLQAGVEVFAHDGAGVQQRGQALIAVELGLHGDKHGVAGHQRRVSEAGEGGGRIDEHVVVVGRYVLQLVAQEELVGGLLPQYLLELRQFPGRPGQAHPLPHPDDDLLERALALDDGAQMSCHVGGKTHGQVVLRVAVQKEYPLPASGQLLTDR